MAGENISQSRFAEIKFKSSEARVFCQDRFRLPLNFNHQPLEIPKSWTVYVIVVGIQHDFTDTIRPGEIKGEFGIRSELFEPIR